MLAPVSGIPSDGPMARPRIRVGETCRVSAQSADAMEESRCALDVECAGTRFRTAGVCTLDNTGQIQRIADLAVSQPVAGRGDGNASVIVDVQERYLVLMESTGHEAVLVELSLGTARSRARYL